MEDSLTFICIGSSALCVILIMTCLFRISSLSKNYKLLIKGFGEKNVEDLMISYSDEIYKVKNDIEGNIKSRISVLEKQMPSCLRHFGVVAYNAFENVSNNMSFSVVALNDKKDGIVITGIYTRESSYVYSKEIVNGQASKELSVEEKEALDKALKN
ncbi:MAG: DUF4446 family protein [Acetivibrionales bacterium]|jgi:hypothetical protein